MYPFIRPYITSHCHQLEESFQLLIKMNGLRDECWWWDVVLLLSLTVTLSTRTRRKSSPEGNWWAISIIYFPFSTGIPLLWCDWIGGGKFYKEVAKDSQSHHHFNQIQIIIINSWGLCINAVIYTENEWENFSSSKISFIFFFFRKFPSIHNVNKKEIWKENKMENFLLYFSFLSTTKFSFLLIIRIA